MNQRLALLSAILANPDDDLPRLVFADWLEENGTTDADAARVEFIRLGCKSKAKSRISIAEGQWLDANWQRLLGHTRISTFPHNAVPGGHSLSYRRSGRYLQLGHSLYTELEFEYDRGFARRVEYRHVLYYRHAWGSAATDEPLAYHRPKLSPRDLESTAVEALLRKDAWGETVYSRVIGFDAELPFSTLLPGINEVMGAELVKVYRVIPSPDAADTNYLPVVLRDVRKITNPRLRQWAAVATAMTAIAREFVGLDPVL